MKPLILYLLLFCVAAHAQTDTSLVEIKKCFLHSEALETEREFWVSLPVNYDSTQTYPVIYVLDAEWRFGIANALEKELATNGKIPQHIVVGIPHPDRKPDMTFSTTKLSFDGESPMDTTYFNAGNTGNGLRFLAFLEDELIAKINRNYSTSEFNVLVGHSLGGYFCSYILPTQNSFNSLQIYDPSIWYGQGEAIKQIEDSLSHDKNSVVFLSSSSNVDKEYNYHHKKIKELNKALKHYPNIRIDYKYYKNESHNSMFLHSFLDGMMMLYDGYELKVGSKHPHTVSSVNNHYKQFSEKVNFNFEPSVELYLEVGQVNFYQKKFDQSIEALEIYIKSSPNDSYALELMGDACVITKDREQGLKHYQNALELAPENERLIKKMENLKKD